ncbi:hypothetical protein GWK08_13020 [Leptobacterium flavescens]|uniref:DUF4097 family beta strand repeat protein n=1 Tax=Leptobacterium flavescens TaxID=472055 RepID=A0A6P0UQU7_9FLAO|nr:hypothetical protein [Leptobacterium flavescens]NER14368.1 hypothetical protein [Leptobacterium flavescens]
MKKLIAICVFLSLVTGTNAQDKEKKISFKSGVVKICMSSNVQISGYDGNEVVITQVNGARNSLYRLVQGSAKSLPQSQNNFVKKDLDSAISYRLSTVYRNVNEHNLKKGLKKLGTSNDPADNLYLDIEEKNGQLIIKDLEKDPNGLTYTVSASAKYQIKIPNTVKLEWNTGNCKKSNANIFFVSSKPWELSNFKGEVEISSSYGSISLVDVSGPVLVNTVGGNIKAVFDKTTPNRLYSLISNDGHIDIQLPSRVSLDLDVSASDIYSDLDFTIVTENLLGNKTKNMKLELNGGKNKMKLDAGFGNVYIRKN